jgi:hypothetical protein
VRRRGTRQTRNARRQHYARPETSQERVRDVRVGVDIDGVLRVIRNTEGRRYADNTVFARARKVRRDVGAGIPQWRHKIFSRATLHAASKRLQESVRDVRVNVV